MLSDDEKERIRAEEEHLAQSRAELEDRVKKERAARAYRAQIATRLGNRKRWLWSLVPITGAALAVAGFALIPRQMPNAFEADPTIEGGITDAELVKQCQDQVQSQLNTVSAAEFPQIQDVKDQIAISSDGKTWDSWVRYWNGRTRQRRNFSCNFTTADCVFRVTFYKD
jgi:hypothetical protein